MIHLNGECEKILALHTYRDHPILMNNWRSGICVEPLVNISEMCFFVSLNFFALCAGLALSPEKYTKNWVPLKKVKEQEGRGETGKASRKKDRQRKKG